MKIDCVVGARPNFMKMAPIIEALRLTPGFEPRLIHTEQHYDAAMSKVFFDELGMPVPDLFLGVGSAGHSEQTARVMIEFDKVVAADRPDLVLVVGDVNSTLAAALVAAKRLIPVGHVEAGLRSFDRTMPEEINRILTDVVSDLLFTTSEDAHENLAAEGIDTAKIRFVGNTMIDSLLKHRERARQTSKALATFRLEPGRYLLVTLHRPANVDEPAALSGLLGALGRLSDERPVLFPVHPRTRARFKEFGLEETIARHPGLKFTDPLGYLDFLALMESAELVLTDSGGIQEETTVLGVPCLTLRPNTERPVTISEGTNLLVGTDPERIVAEGLKVLSGDRKSGRAPRYWDGQAAGRIVAALAERGRA
ncbi:MAG TPA: UDP-N-acetylglucosamine 2-epimerase (non-hydrolyzing) [Candidatus Eisenbacteria bacterium]